MLQRSEKVQREVQHQEPQFYQFIQASPVKLPASGLTSQLQITLEQELSYLRVMVGLFPQNHTSFLGSN